MTRKIITTRKSPNAKHILLILIGTIYTVLGFGAAVMNRHDHLQAESLIPRYRADCAHAARYSPASPNVPCYTMQTYMTLMHHQETKSSYDTATLTLPSGRTAEPYLDDADWYKHTPPPGMYDAEVWNGAVTKIVVRGQTIHTRRNPVTEARNSEGAAVVAPAVIGGVAGLFVFIGGVRLAVSLFRRT